MANNKTKKNFLKKSESNGITITDSISLTINSQYQIRAKIMLVFIALAGCFSFIASFLSLFYFNCDLKQIIKVCCITFILCSVSFLTLKFSKYLPIPFILITGIAVFKNYQSLKFGYLEFLNTIVSKVRPDMTYFFSNPNMISEEKLKKCLTLFICFIMVVIIVTLCYNVIIKPRILLIFSVTFPFIEIGLYFGYSPDHIAFSLLIAFWIAVFSMRIAGNQFHSTTGKPVFVRKKNVFVSSGNLKNNVIETIGVFTLVSVFGILLISSGILKLISFERSEDVNDLRYEIKSSVSDLSFEKVMHSNGENDSNSPVNSKSRLGSVSEITFKDKTVLNVIIDNKISGNLYLKGFIGDKYRKNSWYAIDDSSSAEYLKIFTDLTSKGYCPQNYNSKNQGFYHNFSDFIDNSYFSKTSNHIMIISNFDYNYYLFTPYSIIMENNMIIEDDGSIKSDFMKNYNYNFYENPDFTNNCDDILNEINYINSTFTTTKKPEQLVSSENLYKDYVERHYLEYQNTKENQILYEQFGSQLPKYDGTNLAEIAAKIRNILHSNSEYSLKPGKTPSNTDLVYYMLMDNHKGYCSHFATSAVILARMSGVPARYAEGYVIVPSDFNSNSQQINGYKILVHDSRAHAWAEFYVDGFGWVPFEFTPGYDSGIISAEANDTIESDTTAETTSTAPETDESPTEIQSSASTVVVTTEVIEEYNETDNSSITTAEIKNSGHDISINHPILKTIIIIINVILILTILFFSRHIVTVAMREKKFTEGTNNEKIISYYRYFISLMNSYGISDSNMFPLEFARYAEENTESICSKGEIVDFIKLVEKASFSNESVTESELNKSASFITKTALAIYNSKTGIQKFEFRYLQNLIK